MTGDSASSKDEELLSQIDELKARMDRLMQGGTSTSNSSLLTSPPQQAASTVETRPPAESPPARTRVRDLISPDERESIPDLAAKEEIVAFPEADDSEPAAPAAATARPMSPPPPSKPPVVRGSLVPTGEDRQVDPRPRVTSFEDLGSAIEEDLARDSSVPPPTERKGPDLASRFGAAEEPVAVEPAPVVETGPAVEDDEGVLDEIVEFEEPRERSHVGAVVAIWVFTAVTSGTIATLHFSGII